MKFKISINGMHCASCAANVERALAGVKGVKNASVSVMTKKAFVEGDKLNKTDIEKTIENVGFKVVKIEEM